MLSIVCITECLFGRVHVNVRECDITKIINLHLVECSFRRNFLNITIFFTQHIYYPIRYLFLFCLYHLQNFSSWWNSKNTSKNCYILRHIVEFWIPIEGGCRYGKMCRYFLKWYTDILRSIIDSRIQKYSSELKLSLIHI